MTTARPSVADRLIGRTMDGKYRIEAFIGRGAMGLVFRAIQLDVDKPVALKIMRSDVMSDDTALQRFYREARATSRLSHPNTIKVFESGQFSEGYPYIAMEFLDGEPLHKVIAEDGCLPASRTIKILVQVAKALAEAHKENIVHRDLKPGNIMIMQLYGEHDFVKVLDFGIAKILTDTTSQQLTQAGFALGTPHYMSPEQAKGKPLDARSDLYSLGVIAFQMLTGRVPFQGESSVDVIMKHISEPPPRVYVDGVKHPLTAKLVPILARLLEKDRDRRPQSALELVRALQPLQLEAEQAALEGRIERIDPQAALAGGAGQAVPAQTADVAARTMALRADDLAGLGLGSDDAAPRRGTQVEIQAQPGRAVERTLALDPAEFGLANAPAAPAPALPAPEEAFEKTMALSADEVSSMAAVPTPDVAPRPEPPAAPEPEPEADDPMAATMLFDLSAEDVPVAALAASALTDDAAERTMLFEQLDASLQARAPAAPAKPAAPATPAIRPTMPARRPTVPVSTAPVQREDETMVFHPLQPPEAALSQDGETMMIDAASLVPRAMAPTAGQEEHTVMLDVNAVGLGGDAVNQDGATMMVDARAAQAMMAGIDPAQDARTMMVGAEPPGSTDPALRKGSHSHITADLGDGRAAAGGMPGGWVVWVLIGVGTLAIVSALFVLLRPQV